MILRNCIWILYCIWNGTKCIAFEIVLHVHMTVGQKCSQPLGTLGNGIYNPGVINKLTKVYQLNLWRYCQENKRYFCSFKIEGDKRNIVTPWKKKAWDSPKVSVSWWVACEFFSRWVPTLCLDSSIVSPFQLCWNKSVRMFRCNLPLALWAKWLGSFMCHGHNTGMEQTLNKPAKKVNKGAENSSVASVGNGTCKPWSWVQHSIHWNTLTSFWGITRVKKYCTYRHEIPVNVDMNKEILLACYCTLQLQHSITENIFYQVTTVWGLF